MLRRERRDEISPQVAGIRRKRPANNLFHAASMKVNAWAEDRHYVTLFALGIRTQPEVFTMASSFLEGLTPETLAMMHESRGPPSENYQIWSKPPQPTPFFPFSRPITQLWQ